MKKMYILADGMDVTRFLSKNITKDGLHDLKGTSLANGWLLLKVKGTSVSEWTQHGWEEADDSGEENDYD